MERRSKGDVVWRCGDREKETSVGFPRDKAKRMIVWVAGEGCLLVGVLSASSRSLVVVVEGGSENEAKEGGGGNLASGEDCGNTIRHKFRQWNWGCRGAWALWARWRWGDGAEKRHRWEGAIKSHGTEKIASTQTSVDSRSITYLTTVDLNSRHPDLTCA